MSAFAAWSASRRHLIDVGSPAAPRPAPPRPANVRLLGPDAVP